MFLERADDLPLIDVREPRQVFFAILRGEHEPASHTKHHAHIPGDRFHCGFSNLEKIDVALIDRAARSIDMAAYVLTDWPVIEALSRAAGRGVKVRIYLDSSQLSHDESQAPFRNLSSTAGVEVRVKSGAAFMHLKSFVVDGKTLRTGAANFSASGEKQQDNDLVVIESEEAAMMFEREFEAMFARGSAYVV
jgi:phosphatidylserine/phosphatidylglycerophosphate/cardiolipin synthase-like enzyme